WARRKTCRKPLENPSEIGEKVPEKGSGGQDRALGSQASVIQALRADGLTPPAIPPCADLRACGRGLRAYATASVGGHTCRTWSVRSRWPFLTLLSLVRSDQAGQVPRQASGRSAENQGLRGRLVSPPRLRPRIRRRDIDPRLRCSNDLP